MKKILLLGSGELGKEFVIAAKRKGVYVVACDKYDNAPAMQVADEREVFSMLDGDALAAVVDDYITGLAALKGRRPDSSGPHQAIVVDKTGNLERRQVHRLRSGCQTGNHGLPVTHFKLEIALLGTTCDHERHRSNYQH